MVEVDIKAVGEGESRARFEIGSDLGLIDVGLQFVRDENHGNIGGTGGVGDVEDG